MPGHLFLVIGPSGSGKNTLIDRILSGEPEIRYVPSVTTRPKRPHETEGNPYHFVDETEFLRLEEAGELLEWQRVHGFLYGSSRAEMRKALERGGLSITDLDILGAYKVKAQLPEAVTTVFVIPSSLDELRRRLRARNSETEASLERRLERVRLEMELAYAADFLVFNDELDRAVEELRQAIRSALRARRQAEYFGRRPVFRLLRLHLFDSGREILYRSRPAVPTTAIGWLETAEQAAERLLKAVWWEMFPEISRYDGPLPSFRKVRECHLEEDPETGTTFQVEEREADLTGSGVLARVGRDGEMVFRLG